MRKTCTSIFILVPLALAALALVPGSALAQDTPDIYIVDADIGGSGCPEGTASVVLSEDARTLSVFFDEYVAENSDYAACAVGVALNVPPGFTVALVDIDYRGYASVPDLPGRSARFRAEVFFAGQAGPVFVHDFPRGFDASYMIEHDILGTILAPCGDQVIARANTSLRTRGNGTLATVDTADITTTGVTFYLDWYEC